MKALPWLRTALFIVGLMFLACQPRAQSVSERCPGYDGDPPYPKFSNNSAAWDKELDLVKIVINRPSLEVVEDKGSRRLKVSFLQIKPQCYVSGHVYATLINNGKKLPSLQLFGIVGDLNRPDKPRLFQMLSAQAIPPEWVIDDNTSVNLSLDCGCTSKPGATTRRQNYVVPLFNCDEDVNCSLPFQSVWSGIWPH
ncbi:hypothetical protein AB3X89_06450 [Paraburkholderia sp. BR14320]